MIFLNINELKILPVEQRRILSLKAELFPFSVSNLNKRYKTKFKQSFTYFV